MLLEIYFNECNDLPDSKRSKKDPKYNTTSLTLDEYDYDEWCKEKSYDSTVKGDEEELDDLPPQEGDEKVKEGKELKILTPNKQAPSFISKNEN